MTCLPSDSLRVHHTASFVQGTAFLGVAPLSWTGEGSLVVPSSLTEPGHKPPTAMNFSTLESQEEWFYCTHPQLRRT